MKKAVLAALGVLLLIALTACGSDKSDDKDDKKSVSLTQEEKDTAASIAKAFTEESTGALTTTEANCFAEQFVDSAGLEKLKSAKLIDESGKLNQTGATFDAEVSGDFADAFLGCVDYHRRQAEEIAKADKTVDAKALESCLEDKMPNSYVKKLIVASQTQSEDGAKLGEESNKFLTDCKTEATKK